MSTIKFLHPAIRQARTQRAKALRMVRAAYARAVAAGASFDQLTRLENAAISLEQLRKRAWLEGFQKHQHMTVILERAGFQAQAQT